MEKDEIYIGLFSPLNNDQKNRVWKIWKKSIEEDIYVRKKEIEKFCIENDCDFLSALNNIYYMLRFTLKVEYLHKREKYKKKYFCQFEDPFGVDIFFEERIQEYLNSGKPITEKQEKIIEKMLIIIDEIYDDPIDTPIPLLRFLESINVINVRLIEEELHDLKAQIYLICIERQKNRDGYINNKSNTLISKKELEKNIRLDFHTSYMYYPVSNIIKEKETENPSLDNINQDNDIKNSINIDIKAFKAYFKPNLTSESEDSIFNRLITDLKGSLNGYNESDILAISKIIYECGGLHHSKKPSTPRKWYIEFCSLINRRVSTIKPNQIKKQFKKLKDTYEYIYNQ